MIAENLSHLQKWISYHPACNMYHYVCEKMPDRLTEHMVESDREGDPQLPLSETGGDCKMDIPLVF